MSIHSWCVEQQKIEQSRGSGTDNITTNRLFAYQQYTTKLENLLRILVNAVIITSCTTLILLGYIASRGI